MSMSKQDFIALADMLRTARMGITTVCEEHTAVKHDGCEDCDREWAEQTGHNPFKDEHIQFLADFCETQNPRFNRSRWLSYIAGECGKNGGKLKAAWYGTRQVVQFLENGRG